MRTKPDPVGTNSEDLTARGEGAGCFGYGENKQKGDNEGGLKPRPASSTRFVFIITNQGKKTSFFKNFFHPVAPI